MKRRPLSRDELLARMPRAFRPRLKPDQLRDLGLCHHVNLDAIAKGEANKDILWHFVGSVLTWSRVAQLLDIGVPEMTEQLSVAHRLIERYRTTGRAVFSGPDLQLARDGVVVMDQLAEITDRPTAMAAADWSEAKLNELANGAALEVVACEVEA